MGRDAETIRTKLRRFRRRVRNGWRARRRTVVLFTCALVLVVAVNLIIVFISSSLPTLR